MEGSRPDKEIMKQPQDSVNLPLEYRKINDSCLRTGLLINLNDKGSLFHCRAEMSVGTILKLRLMFADGYELTSFEACAKIVSKDPHFERDWREYKYGAEFTHISEEDKPKLNRLLFVLSHWHTVSWIARHEFPSYPSTFPSVIRGLYHHLAP